MEESLVAREDELRLVRAVAAFDSDSSALMIEGEAGIGKTALWRAGLAEARAAGAVVRAATAAESETRFAYAPLADLLHDLPSRLLAEVAPVQRSALERALLVGETTGDVELHAVSAGFTAVLRALAAESPLVVAVDDVQWLDAASSAVLSYALRRAAGPRVAFLLTRRLGAGSDGLPDTTVVRLEPLTVGALQRLLLRHGHTLSGLAVRRIHERSGGNPFFALEMARAVARRGGALDGLDVPVPETLLGLLDERMAGLDPDAERAVLAAAVAAEPLLGILVDVLGGEEGLDAAEAAGLVVRDDGRARLVHPLVGTAARARASAPVLRRLHAAFADAVASDEERARHLALATVPPDEAVAAALEVAAGIADARGATAAAAELSREAVRFSGGDDPAARRRRLLAVGDRHMRAGLLVEGLALLEPELATFPPGPERVQATFHLLRLARRDNDLSAWEDAAAQATGALRAEILAELAFSAAAGAVDRLDEARRWAEEAAALAAAAGERALELSALQSVGFIAAMQGDPAPSFPEGERPLALPLTNAPSRLAAVTAVWRGDVDTAEVLLDELFEEANVRGEEWAVAAALVHRFELEARIGDVRRLEETVDLFERVTAPLGPLVEETLPRMRSFVAAFVGDVDGMVELPAGAAAWQWLETRRAAGLAALFAGDVARAAAALLAVHERATAARVRDPGVFPAAGDAAEALVLLGRLDEARALAGELSGAARALAHPWAGVVGARVDGLVAAADGDAAAADEAFRLALARHASVRLPLDEARTRLAYGAFLRRERRLREAREQLEAASASLAALGVTPLAARARAELDRIPGRRSTAGLTPAEEQVARLVAQGLTNREVAAALVVSPKVVERHLTRIYAKLGLRTRAQLVRLVAESGGIPRLERTPADA